MTSIQSSKPGRALNLIRRLRTKDPLEREAAGYVVLDHVRRRVLPEYLLTDYRKNWYKDQEFLTKYRRFKPDADTDADRKFFLQELLKLVAPLDGDTAEAGVYAGGSSWFICEARQGRSSTHWAFDSFAGLSAPGQHDGSEWHSGDLTAAESNARRLLEPYGAQVIRGWIPEVFTHAQIERLAFCHVDVDLYEPTLASLEFFYPRLVPGGIFVCDDYGLWTCPGATRAVDEFMSDRPEPVLNCPTAQGIIIKQ